MNTHSFTTFTLTVDIEGEWFQLPGEQGSFDVNKVIAAVQHMEVQLNHIESKLGTKIPITWFIRCDDSVAAATGYVSGLLHSLDSFILRRKARGDEFGLHPHLYVFSQNKWHTETNPDKQVEQIERAVSAWSGYFGTVPRLSRMGEALMNNTVASSLAKLGIEIDSSALAGRSRFDNGFQFDWIGTPSSAYFPSTSDYRRPAIGSEHAHQFLEVPFTMLPIMSPQDNELINRYCNLAFKPDIIKSAAQRMNKPEHIIAVLHPHELKAFDHPHPLIAYDPTSLWRNIQNFSNILGGLNFSLLSECPHNVAK